MTTINDKIMRDKQASISAISEAAEAAIHAINLYYDTFDSQINNDVDRFIERDISVESGRSFGGRMTG